MMTYTNEDRVKFAELTSKGKALMGELRMAFRESVALARKHESLAECLSLASLRCTELIAEDLYRDVHNRAKQGTLILKVRSAVQRASEALEANQLEIEKNCSQIAEADKKLADVLVERYQLQLQKEVVQ